MHENQIITVLWYQNWPKFCFICFKGSELPKICSHLPGVNMHPAAQISSLAPGTIFQQVLENPAISSHI